MSDPERKWYGFVPNLITTLNLVCGVVGIHLALQGKIQFAMILLLAGAFFDFIDGFAARLLKTSSELGKQLDSLADLVTFGILPGAMVFWVQDHLLIKEAGSLAKFEPLQWVMYGLPIVIPVFSAWRLAKFNIDTRQTESFLGLPTPANAIFLATLVWCMVFRSNGVWGFANNPFIISGLVLVFSTLLVVELPLFSLKFKKKKGKDNSIRLIFLISSAFILIVLKLEGLPFIILLYIFLSLLRPLLVKVIYSA